jgi:uncharacterized protein DUF4345
MNELRIEHRIIRVLMVVLGIAAVGIGAMVFLIGVQFIQLTESSFNFATGQSIPVDPAAISPTIDNEFRFYSIFWLSYGVVVLWVARNILAQLRLVPLLVGLFFIGGVGRALSHIFVGTPHPAFIGLMVIELVAPVFVLILYTRIPKR